MSQHHSKRVEGTDGHFCHVENAVGDTGMREGREGVEEDGPGK
jgi:hypothetical protein